MSLNFLRCVRSPPLALSFKPPEGSWLLSPGISPGSAKVRPRANPPPRPRVPSSPPLKTSRHLTLHTDPIPPHRPDFPPSSNTKHSSTYWSPKRRLLYSPPSPCPRVDPPPPVATHRRHWAAATGRPATAKPLWFLGVGAIHRRVSAREVAAVFEIGGYSLYSLHKAIGCELHWQEPSPKCKNLNWNPQFTHFLTFSE